MYTNKQIASVLDLAVLRPTATCKDVKIACDLANTFKIKSVCVPPIYVGLANTMFDNVSAVIGYPHGNSMPDTKYREALQAMRDGAKELDVVINYGCFLDGDTIAVQTELVLIVMAARPCGVLVKAILETCHYTPDQIVAACKLCADLGVDFVKTATGVVQGATPGVVKLMIDAVRGRCGVKASGGICTYEDARVYLDLGCTRIGASSYSALLR